MIIIGIDPGLNGGIATYTDIGLNKSIELINMPATPKDICIKLADIKETGDFINEELICYIEKVGTYVSGNSATAAVKFARIEAFLIALRIPLVEVTAKQWEYWLIGKPNYPKISDSIKGLERNRILAKRKTERKNKIKDTLQRQYPDLKITLKTSDALGIMKYGMEKEK